MFLKKRTQLPPYQQQNQRKQLPHQQQQQIMSQNLAPLPQPSTSGGIMITGKQLPNAQQRSRQQQLIVYKSQIQSQTPRMYPNGNNSSTAVTNPITIEKIPHGASHDKNN